MNTKLVTAYYPYGRGAPVWGKHGRNSWYKYSLASICKTNVPITCYTDPGIAADELNAYKEKVGAHNLTIKEQPITDCVYHDRIYDIRVKHHELYNNESHPFYSMPFTIYWNKWTWLKQEYQPDTYVYWIDAGLSTEGVFPRRAISFSTEDGYTERYNGDPAQEYKFFSVDKVFTPELFNKINTFTEDKVLNLCRRGRTDNDFARMEEKLKVSIYQDIYRDDMFPVASLFGGNTPLLLTYIDKINEVCEKILSLGDYLCTEQEIMGYVHTYNREIFKDWMFNDFYHEDWKISVNNELIPYREYSPSNVSFSQFWLDTI